MTRDIANSPPSPERLRFLARQLHGLGERPLYELFAEVSRGAGVWDALERYARIAPFADFIRQHGGAELPVTRLIIPNRKTAE